MKKNYIGLCVLMSIITLASSCVDEVPAPDVNVIPSKDIVFGSVMTDDIIITRSGEAGPRTVSEKVIASEVGDVSLPIVVEVEKGIHRPSAPATKATITHDKDDINRLDAWAIYTKYTDATQTTFQKRSLYFKESDPDGAPLSFTKAEDGIFYSDGTKYPWPGDATAMFNFVTVSPVNSGFQARLNTLNNIVSFDYTVPADPAQHKDILVASPEMIETDFRQPVPLTFKHVMAAVNVKVGEVPNGKITSVKFTGVYNKGSYFPDGDGWTNRTIADGGEFSVNLPAGGIEVDAASAGTVLTSGEAGFMMIPQQLYSGAELQVGFLDQMTGKELILRAGLQGDVWEINTTTNYIISINDNYNLSIVPQDNILDSHYIMTRVEISSEYPNWSVSVVADDGAEVTVQKESELNPLARDGFWTDKKVTKNSLGDYVIDYNSTEDCRGGIATGGSTSTEMLVVFIPENITGKTRTITVTLDGYDANGTPQTSKTVELKQNPVKWLNPTGNTAANPDSYWGCELLIEGGPIKWGFCWDGLYTTFILQQGGASYNPDTDQYGKGQIPAGQYKKVLPAMELAGIDVNKMTDKILNDNDKEIPNPNYDPNYYIQVASSGKHEYFIRIDLSKIGNLGVAEDDDNGWQNTFDVYHFEGISALKQLIDFCNSWDGITNPDGRATKLKEGLDYAVMYAMKRNRFYFYEELIQEVGKTMTVPVIFDNDINWYLPARDQFPILMQSNWGQQFSWDDLFWTSTIAATSETDNAHAYAYLNGIETIAHRNDNYLTFALRRYSNSTGVQIPIKPEDVIKPGEDNGPEYGEGGDKDNDDGSDMEAGAGNN